MHPCTMCQAQTHQAVHAGFPRNAGWKIFGKHTRHGHLIEILWDPLANCLAWQETLERNGSELWSHVAEVAGLLRVKASDDAPWRISIIELYVIQIGKVSNLLFRWLNSTNFSSMTLVDWRRWCWVKIMRMICLLHRKTSTELECVFWGLLFT